MGVDGIHPNPKGIGLSASYRKTAKAVKLLYLSLFPRLPKVFICSILFNPGLYLEKK